MYGTQYIVLKQSLEDLEKHYIDCNSILLNSKQTTWSIIYKT